MAIKYENWLESYQPFHWFAEFYEIVHDKGGFDIVIGNPPYVSYAKVKSTYSLSESKYNTISCNNLYAFVIEVCLSVIHKESSFGFIIPLSSTNANDNNSFQKIIRKTPFLALSHFGMRPSRLFNGVDMNLTIVIGRWTSKNSSNQTYTSRFYRWKAEYRSSLFENIEYIANNKIIKKAAFPKFSRNIELLIWDKLMKNKLSLSTLTTNEKYTNLYFHGFGRYWRKCINEQLSDNYQKFSIPVEYEPFAFCVLNSQLAYWGWVVQGDCYRFTKTDALSFSITPSAKNKDYENLHNSLLSDYEIHSKIIDKKARNNSMVREKQFFPQKSKSIIDAIDTVLAKHYGFTDEELDFIINYDIKYRMGKDLEVEEGE